MHHSHKVYIPLLFIFSQFKYWHQSNILHTTSSPSRWFSCNCWVYTACKKKNIFITQLVYQWSQSILPLWLAVYLGYWPMYTYKRQSAFTALVTMFRSTQVFTSAGTRWWQTLQWPLPGGPPLLQRLLLSLPKQLCTEWVWALLGIEHIYTVTACVPQCAQHWKFITYDHARLSVTCWGCTLYLVLPPVDKQALHLRDIIIHQSTLTTSLVSQCFDCYEQP